MTQRLCTCGDDVDSMMHGLPEFHLSTCPAHRDNRTATLPADAAALVEALETRVRTITNVTNGCVSAYPDELCIEAAAYIRQQAARLAQVERERDEARRVAIKAEAALDAREDELVDLQARVEAAERGRDAALEQAWLQAEVNGECIKGMIDAQDRADTLQARVKALSSLLAECADELAEDIGHRHGDPVHPSQKRRYERDMDAVIRARAALKEAHDAEST